MNVGSAGHCCGMIDFNGMNKGNVNEHPEPEDIVRCIAEKCAKDVPGTKSSTGGTVLFTERRTNVQARRFPGTRKLAAFIKENKLGTFTSLGAAPNPVHMDRTFVKPSLWNPDWAAVTAWWEAQKFPKPQMSARRW